MYRLIHRLVEPSINKSGLKMYERGVHVRSPASTICLIGGACLIPGFNILSDGVHVQSGASTICLMIP